MEKSSGKRYGNGKPLGGNDVATDLIEDLKGLPTEPQKKKEGVEDDT